MEWFFILIIFLSIAGPIFGIIFWLVVIRAAVNHVQAFDKEQRNLMKLADKYAKKAKKGKVPPKVNQEMMHYLMNMRNHTNQMNGFRRQQYETKIDGMVSNVVGQGFTDFDPGSLY